MLTDDEIFALFPEEEDDLALARAVEQAAYAAAIKACESKKAWSKFLVASRNDTCDECIDAIRALMEQPK